MKNKKTVLAVVLGSMVHMGLLAQGYPVMDITNILSSIQNGYTMVQQLQAMYNNLKTAYDQLQQQIKNFESFDFNALDAKDPLGSWRSLTTYADRMMTYEQNIETIVKRKDIRIGNGSYSLGDLFTTPVMKDMAMDAWNFTVVDPFEKRLTPAEKTVFHRKYGMSYGNYMRINQMGEILKKKASEVAGYSGSLQQNLAEDREKLSSITGNLFGSESAVQQQQINNAVLSIMAQDVKTQANLLGEIANQVATASAQAQIEKQAQREEINMNGLDFSEGFMNMLNEKQPANTYR
jgi:conjugal transfer/entry exclusion protein